MEPPLPEKVMVPVRSRKPTLMTLNFTSLKQSPMQTEVSPHPSLTGPELKYPLYRLSDGIELMRRRLYEVSSNNEILTDKLLDYSSRNASLISENQDLTATLTQLNYKIEKAEELMKSSSALKPKVLRRMSGTTHLENSEISPVEIADDDLKIEERC